VTKAVDTYPLGLRSVVVPMGSSVKLLRVIHLNKNGYAKYLNHSLIEMAPSIVFENKAPTFLLGKVMKMHVVFAIN
jgi:hypothetical protein